MSEAEDPRRDEVLLDLGGPAHHALRPAVEVGAEHAGVAAVEGAPGDGERGVAHGLLDLGHEELVDRSLGSVLDAVEAVRQADAHEALEHVRFDDRPGEVPALLVVEVDLRLAPAR